MSDLNVSGYVSELTVYPNPTVNELYYTQWDIKLKSLYWDLKKYFLQLGEIFVISIL